MFLAITGGILGGVVALGALYDYVARRHGRSTGMSASGPLNGKNIRVDITHEEYYRR